MAKSQSWKIDVPTEAGPKVYVLCAVAEQSNPTILAHPMIEIGHLAELPPSTMIGRLETSPQRRCHASFDKGAKVLDVSVFVPEALHILCFVVADEAEERYFAVLFVVALHYIPIFATHPYLQRSLRD
jgi:hypothetical protein